MVTVSVFKDDVLIEILTSSERGNLILCISLFWEMFKHPKFREYCTYLKKLLQRPEVQEMKGYDQMIQSYKFFGKIPRFILAFRISICNIQKSV